MSEQQKEQPAKEEAAPKTWRTRVRGLGKYVAGAIATLLLPVYLAYKVGKATLYEGLYKRSWQGAAKDYAEGFGSSVLWPFYWLWKGTEGSYNLYKGERLPWD